MKRKAMEKTVQEHMNTVLEKTFNVLQKIYGAQRNGMKTPMPETGSHLIFPPTRDGAIRISEQELRFVLVEQLNKEIKAGWDVYYSVEVPTFDTYAGFSTNSPCSDPTGRSGEFDLAIFDKNQKRICLVEFKAHNSEESNYSKDFCKLTNKKEKCETTYFINLLKNADTETFKSLHAKINQQLESGIIFRFWSLERGEDVTENILNYHSNQAE